MQSKLSPLEPINDSSFSYGSEGFIVSKVHRENASRLQELLHPDKIKGKVAQRHAREDARKLFTKYWLEAQHKHYDIGYKKSSTKDDLRITLETALANGQVNLYDYRRLSQYIDLSRSMPSRL